MVLCEFEVGLGSLQPRLHRETLSKNKIGRWCLFKVSQYQTAKNPFGLCFCDFRDAFPPATPLPPFPLSFHPSTGCCW